MYNNIYALSFDQDFRGLLSEFSMLLIGISLIVIIRIILYFKKNLYY